MHAARRQKTLARVVQPQQRTRREPQCRSVPTPARSARDKTARDFLWGSIAAPSAANPCRAPRFGHDRAVAEFLRAGKGRPQQKRFHSTISRRVSVDSIAPIAV